MLRSNKELLSLLSVVVISIAADITCEEMQCSMSQKCLRDLTTGRLQCLTCDFDCNMMENKGPVCGTDNVTYQDWCQLRRTACQTGIVINTKHNGACHGE